MDLLKLSLEELLYLRLGQFFDQLSGRKIPELYKVLLDQVDRAVLRQALERSEGQVGAAAVFLGLDRNTLARKAKRLKVSTDARQENAERVGARARGRKSAR